MQLQGVKKGLEAEQHIFKRKISIYNFIN